MTATTHTPTTCTVPGCDRKRVARARCTLHWGRAKSGGWLDQDPADDDARWAARQGEPPAPAATDEPAADVTAGPPVDTPAAEPPLDCGHPRAAGTLVAGELVCRWCDWPRQVGRADALRDELTTLRGDFEHHARAADRWREVLDMPDAHVEDLVFRTRQLVDVVEVARQTVHQRGEALEDALVARQQIMDELEVVVDLVTLSANACTERARHEVVFLANKKLRGMLNGARKQPEGEGAPCRP